MAAYEHNHKNNLEPDDFSHVKWLEPWELSSDPLQEELMREIGAKHALSGCQAICVGRRVDNDDVLFLLPFEILSPAAAQSNFALLKTPITYAPSAAALRITR